ncbi:unnamed protein product [Rhodiola kirilowii]
MGDVISPSMAGDEKRIDLEYNNIVSRILLLHLGPVRKVVFLIPYFGYTLPSEFLSSWMHFISRTEVKELIVVDHHSLKFRLPSDIFHCNELRHLKLHVRTLDLLPPQDFGGFCNLISLDLRVSEDEGVIGNLISKCPMLIRLSLECIACRHPLVIDAPRLRFLDVFIGIDPEDISFDFGGGDVMDFCNLISIFGSVPKVDTVILYLPPTLAVTDMPPDAPMSLPTTLYDLKSLTLQRVDISSPKCIYFVLCVLKNSPNLQMLNLGVIDILPSETSEDEAALHFLDLQTRKIEALKSLLTVKIKGLLGSKTGVMFIRMILSVSPVLKTMYLTGNDSIYLYSRSGKEIRNEAEFTLMPELLQCPRASSRAQNLIGITLGFGPLGTKKFCELFDIFGSLPNVREVILINLRTINDMPRDAPTSLPTTLHNHSRLTLHNLGISSPQCICFILCIFKSSPNLRKLNIRIHPSAYISEEDALQLLDMKIKEPQTLNSLLTVTIKGLLGSRVEIMFIKLILSSTPVLETMYLTGNIVKEAEFTLMSELLKCKRPSPQAQIPVEAFTFISTELIQTTEMGSKQIETDSSLPEPDRISDLPSDINSFILDRLSIREAVATSILSKDWRHKWRRIGNLIFDEEFLADVISPSMEGDDERMDLEYNNIVRRILLLHLGPVRKVVLFIPYFAHTFPCEFLSSWMPFISRTEVKELIIENHHSLEFRLPSDIFHCNELQHLKLNVWTLDLLPPQDFGGFCNLISLDLRVSGDEGVIGNLISKCPLLERLSLDCTACKQPLVIDAPRLLFLNVCIGMDLYMFHRMNFFGLRPCFGVDVMYFSNLISIFGSVPKVETVILTLPPTLAVFDMPPDAPMSLPTTLYNHKSLTLLRVDISSPECIYFVLCVLKSSPNLQMLNLGVIDVSQPIVPSDTSEDEAALHFLGLQTRKIKALKSLLTVKIKGLLESKTGVMFIKMILSCSPVLKTMYLTGNDSTFLYSRSGEEIRNEAEFALMPELL